MASSVGDKLGPYEIVALIGKGGMGEVYRGIDTRLGRPVAIEISGSNSATITVIPSEIKSAAVRAASREPLRRATFHHD
jgi:serine/threonine protein kinase